MEQQLGGPSGKSMTDSFKRLEYAEAETIHQLAKAANALVLVETGEATETVDLICERIQDLARP